jgi:hypothetical protein
MIAMNWRRNPTCNRLGFYISDAAAMLDRLPKFELVFISVRERTREIGLRQAKNHDILAQFLLEAVTLPREQLCSDPPPPPMR